jgi:isoleucyl-tRNA synthetase
LWVATSDYREDIRISQEILRGLTDTYRKIRNTLRFLLGNLCGFAPESRLEYDKLRDIDKYALHKLQDVVNQVRNAYDSCEFHKAAVSINNYCTVFLSGFYLDGLKDTLYCDGKEWPSRKSAQSALFEICRALIRLLAPVLSFTAEEAWQELRKIDAGCEESVFLASMPEVDKRYVLGEKEDGKWQEILKARDKALLELEELRKERKIGSNMEARLEISGLNKEAGMDLLCTVMGTWDIVLKEGGKADAQVSAGKSELAKCERCWRYTSDTNTDNSYKGSLCARCVKALDESGVSEAQGTKSKI